MMLLRFDHRSYPFEPPASPGARIATSVQHLLGEVANNNHGTYNTRHGFNDLSFYLDLVSQLGCTRVDLHAIDVHTNERYCLGIRAIYRCTFRSRESVVAEAPEHVYRRGYYSYTGGQHRVSRFVLQDGEYVADVRTRQGEITDQITLVTNRRSVSFGGDGGSGEDPAAPVDLSRKIVAFVGTSNGVLERLGAVSVTRNWEVVGPLVLVRALVERRRAEKKPANAGHGEQVAVTQALVAETTDDAFRRVLSFLVPGVDISG